MYWQFVGFLIIFFNAKSFVLLFFIQTMEGLFSQIKKIQYLLCITIFFYNFVQKYF